MMRATHIIMATMKRAFQGRDVSFEISGGPGEVEFVVSFVVPFLSPAEERNVTQK